MFSTKVVVAFPTKVSSEKKGIFLGAGENVCLNNFHA
jgi:hypothetical protein